MHTLLREIKWRILRDLEAIGITGIDSWAQDAIMRQLLYTWQAGFMAGQMEVLSAMEEVCRLSDLKTGERSAHGNPDPRV